MEIPQKVNTVEHHYHHNDKISKYAKVTRIDPQNPNNYQIPGNNIYNQYGINLIPEQSIQNQQNQGIWKKTYMLNNFSQQYNQQPISYNYFPSNQNYNY